jgi:Ala-tRNA(Pro) deacylase
MHESGKSVAKAVVFCRADGTMPVMFVVSAADMVDVGVAETIAGSGARLATETELGLLFPDCQLGAHPPFGSFYGIRTILDDELRQHRGNIIFLLGHHDESTSMAMSDYASLARPEIRRIRKTP